MRRSHRCLFLILASACAFTIVLNSQGKNSRAVIRPASEIVPALHGFPEYINARLKEWNVPGAAIAIVKGGRVIFSEGFGLRDIARKLPVTPHTIMPIGSSTKAFTTLAIGTLVDEGKLDWDTPVRSYIPTFRMYDSFATERMTLRDMACHRSGLPRHELMWLGSPFNREQLFDRLQYLEPNKDFRSCYQYQNLVYMAAGYIAGKIAGTNWEQLVRERIFMPLDMTSANFSGLESQKTGDAAKPYLEKEGVLEELPLAHEDAVGPAGSICAHVLDMAKWVELHLGKGEFNGKRIVSEPTLKLLHTAQMPIEEDDPISEEMRQYRELGDKSYAFGWTTGTYRGHRLVEHGGNTEGFTASVQMLPDDGTGVVVLTNADHTDLSDVICYQVFDRLLGLDRIDWSSRMRKLWQKILDMISQAKQQATAERKLGTRPSHPLADYAGEYEHPGYGTFLVKREGETLTGYYNGHDWPIKHHHYDIFSFEFWMFGMSYLGTFHTDTKGNIDSLSLPLENTVKEIVFKRKGENQRN
jgi:CubicO group peptidase (beta-lactamase class C family)